MPESRPLRRELTVLTQTGKRVTTRIAGSVQKKLQMAADLVGATLNQFIVQAAIEKANRVIESESVMVLSRKESLRILELIENPPPRNKAFLEAQAWHERMMRNAHSSTK